MSPDTPPDPAPDYRDTLNLPSTDFPMRAGLPKREPEWLERWERIGVYDRLRERAAQDPGGCEPFTLHDGPPYANGHLHIGHALNKILKDMVVRSRQMMGADARYVPGWDCHGLPIEWKVEERYRARGRDKDQVPVVEFRRECREFAAQWVDVQREEFRRLGVTGNWADPYLTMDPHAEAVIAESFQKFLMSGVLYQGSKPVMWSPVEKTALAEAEVEYHDRQTDAVWVSFPVIRTSLLANPMVAGEDDGSTPSYEVPPHNWVGIQVVIWTTTPWTIPQNRAVCFSRDALYGMYRVKETQEVSWVQPGQTLILADSLAEQTFEEARVSKFARLGAVSEYHLRRLTLGHPFRGAEGAGGEWDFDVPLLPGEHVTDDVGTGFVHTAPSHGEDDYEIGRRHGLPMTYNVEGDGTFREGLPFFGGEAILKPDGKPGGANRAVIDKLVEVGALLARRRITISDAHSWRSKAPVIRLNRPQWFAAIDRPVGDGMNEHGATIRERALRSTDELVTFTPRTGRNRLHAMLSQRPDWVLSRQRAWGVPLTAFTKRGAKPDDPGFLLRDEAVNARILEAFEAEGADAWYEDGAKARFLGDHDPDEWDMVSDILDVWFDSGSTHAFVLRDRSDGTRDGLADVYLEGTDQHRGWFQSSMLQGCGTIGRAPYRAVVTHAFTLDERGAKMSKSVGNVILPEEVVRQYGADILRLWVAQTDYAHDHRIGPEILKGVADGYRRLRNTLRFVLGNLPAGETPRLWSDGSSGHGKARSRRERDALPELERWVLHRIAEVDARVREGYRAYDFQGVWQAVFGFATGDLSSFYFDVRKDALYCDADEGPRRRAALFVLGELFERLTVWLAPMLPFTMEEVWLERRPGEDSSIHLRDMPEVPEGWRDEALAARWERIRRVRRVVTGALEAARRDKVIGASLEAAPVVHVDEETARLLEGTAFDELCIVSGATLTGAPAPDGAFRLEDVPGVAVEFARAEGEKCLRCWRVLPDVGTHAHPGVCARCDAVLG